VVMEHGPTKDIPEAVKTKGFQVGVSQEGAGGIIDGETIGDVGNPKNADDVTLGRSVKRDHPSSSNFFEDVRIFDQGQVLSRGQAIGFHDTQGLVVFISHFQGGINHRREPAHA